MDMTPGYKRTEVGVIPEDWEIRHVREAGDVLGGRQRSPQNRGMLTKYLRVANVFDGFIDTQDVLEMPFSPAEKQRFLLKNGDILLNEGQSLELVGRSAIYRGNPEDCCFQNTLIRFRAGPGTCPEFAQCIFQQYLRTGIFASIALQTTSIAHLGAGRLATLKLPFPPKAEQEAISEALSAADALIGSLEQLLAKKHQIKQCAMQELLSGRRRLPGFESKPGYRQTEVGVIPEDWEIKSIAQIGPLQRGFDLPTSRLKEGPYPVVYSNGATAFHAAATVQGPGVVTGRSGTLGKVHYIETDYWPHNTSLWVTRFNGNDERFVYYLYSALRFERFASGSGVPTLNRNDAHGFHTALPAKRAEQKAIAETLSDMDAEIAALKAKLAKVHQLKQGMMQELLTGRIRLV